MAEMYPWKAVIDVGQEQQDPWEVPEIDWEKLAITEELGEGRKCNVFGGILTLEDSGTVEVAVKEHKRNPRRSSVWHEAEVLHVLAGVRGVPRLYGITSTYPHGLIMSKCRGTTLKALNKSGQTRSCLFATVALCNIVSELHGRRVCHRDLHSGNLLVEDVESGSNNSEVWLIDFGQATLHATENSMEVDQLQLKRLLNNITRKAPQAIRNQQDIFNHSLLQECLPAAKNVAEISSVVSSALSNASYSPLN